MKKFVIIMILAVLSVSSFAQRWQNAPADNTGRQLTFADKIVTVTGHDSITPNASHTFYTFTTLVKADTLLLRTHDAKKWDMITLKFTCDTLTAGRIVTFVVAGTGGHNTSWTTTSGNTMTVKKSKFANISFLYDGVRWGEFSRNIQY